MSKNGLDLSLTCLFLLFVGVSCSFNYEVKESPKYSPTEPITRIEVSDEDLNRGKQGVDRFHDLLNQGKSNEIFDWIDDKSQLKSEPIAISARVRKINSELGTVANTELQRSGVFEKSKTKEIRLEYVTKFSKEKDPRPRYELFYFELYPSGETRLLEYMNGIDNEKGY